jgi:hypothetical protein
MKKVRIRIFSLDTYLCRKAILGTPAATDSLKITYLCHLFPVPVPFFLSEAYTA